MDQWVGARSSTRHSPELMTGFRLLAFTGVTYEKASTGIGYSRASGLTSTTSTPTMEPERLRTGAYPEMKVPHGSV